MEQQKIFMKGMQGKLFLHKKVLTSIFIVLSFDIWEGKINAMVNLPNGKVPTWLNRKNYFQTSDKILQ